MNNGKDNLDAFIIAHHRSMSQREIAKATGTSKSSVSRHYAALKNAGELDGCANADHDGEVPNERLDALEELIKRLYAELDTTGGASLARVSSELRKALEEREKLKEELGLTRDNRYTVTMLDYVRMGISKSDYGAYSLDPWDAWDAGVKRALEYLDVEGAIIVKDGILDDEDAEEPSEE